MSNVIDASAHWLNNNTLFAQQSNAERRKARVRAARLRARRWLIEELAKRRRGG